MARPLYCSVSPEQYYPEKMDKVFDLGYMGTFSADRQDALNRMLIWPAIKWSKG